MKIQAVKGTRDLYPELYAPIRHIFDVWRKISLRHGFEEYEGPTMEFLELYREKSGEELVGQLYHLVDSGGRELALRPEMTPTLARMVAARINTLQKPIKWFCIPNMFRGENVQRGRLREFYQWNVDVIGSADVTADAECILVGVEALRELGLTADDFQVHISSRRLIRALLLAAGIPEEAHGGAYAIMDKAGKLERSELARRWTESYGSYLPFEGLEELLDATDLEMLGASVARRWGRAEGELEAAVGETQALLGILCDFGITEFCKINMHVVRGLAYYTGPVFEFYDRSENERAICGGGRYDDLLGKLGKSREPAVGFGMGDVVLGLLLSERSLGLPRKGGSQIFVADAAEGLREEVRRVTAALRRGGFSADFCYAWQPLGKQLKAADKKGCRVVLIVGEETVKRGAVQIKDMVGGGSREVPLAGLLQSPGEFLGVEP